jgi:hypothetical protein
MEEIPANEQMGDAVIKLMKLARAALDAGRIADASRLLRLAAAASENQALMEKVRNAPDTVLTGTASGEIASKGE